MITFNFIFARKHNETDAYPVRVGFNEAALPAILAKYQEIIAPAAGKEFREAHAEVLVASFNSVSGYQVHEFHEFPNPADLKKRAAGDARREAINVAAAMSAAEKELAIAKTNLAAAKAKKSELSPEQKAIIAPPLVAIDPHVAAYATDALRRANAARKLAESESISGSATEQLTEAQ